jgi:hypothetical protein
MIPFFTVFGEPSESKLSPTEAFWKSERIEIQVFFNSRIVWLSDFESLLKIECDYLWRIKNMSQGWFGVSIFVMFDILSRFIQKTKGVGIKYAVSNFPSGYEFVNSDLPVSESLETLYFIKNWDRQTNFEEYISGCQKTWNLSPELFPFVTPRTIKVREIMSSIEAQLQQPAVVEAVIRLSDLISDEFMGELTRKLSNKGFMFEISSNRRFLRVSI